MICVNGKWYKKTNTPPARGSKPSEAGAAVASERGGAATKGQVSAIFDNE
jgi:hypothetical protein